jgi:hypothetical protein
MNAPNLDTNDLYETAQYRARKASARKAAARKRRAQEALEYASIVAMDYEDGNDDAFDALCPE